MKKVGLYVRVSTQEQKLHGISIENQLDALQKYCKEKGYIIVATYNDAGVSAHGSYKKRPALLQIVRKRRLNFCFSLALIVSFARSAITTSLRRKWIKCHGKLYGKSMKQRLPMASFA